MPPSTPSSSDNPTANPSTSHAEASADVAHHINEFGEIEANAVVHFSTHGHSSDNHDDAVPVYGARADPTHPDKPRRRTHASNALARLFRKPTLQQFFYNDVLFRHKHGRSVSREELFLDLVLVAGVATLGHHLRAEPLSWPLVESFILLFFVVYAAWRQIVLLWNYWGVNEDMLDKIGIYLTFVCIVGVSLGSYNPFSEHLRGFVAVSSFMASFVPLLESFLWARADPLLKIPSNRTNALSVGCVLSTLSLLPLLAASFVHTERAAKSLFWVSVAMQMLSTVLPTYIVRYLHRKNSRYLRPAINIEHAAEKFEVLTMIFMGEAVLALLFEGAPLVAKESSKAGKLYLAGFLCTAMLYSFQTLYVQVDNRILRRGKHALRHNAGHGMTWAALHMPYHLSLVLVATGLGFALRDVAFPPKHSDASAAIAAATVHAASVLKPGTENFTTAARWLFSAGWAASMCFSALMSFAHVGGPRAATKLPRFVVRCVVAIGMMVGMPFTSVNAIGFLAIFAGVSSLIAIAELVLVQLDRVGLFRSEMLSATGNYVASGANGRGAEEGEKDGGGDSSDTTSECSVADEIDEEDIEHLQRVISGMTSRDMEVGLGGEEETEMEEVPDVVARALQRRMTHGHESRLVRKQKPKGWHQRPHALG